MSRPCFLVPLDVTDSIVKSENCILFTQRLQYATFPLYSLQLTTHSTCTAAQTYKDTRNVHAQMIAFAHEHGSGLEALPPHCPSFSTLLWHFCPDMSLKSVTGSGAAISAAPWLQMGRRDGGEGRNDELVLDHACKPWKQPILTRLSSSAVLSSGARHRQLFTRSYSTRAGDLNLTKSSITFLSGYVVALHRGAASWISAENTGAPFALFIAAASSFLDQVLLSPRLPLPTPPSFPPLSLQTGWPRCLVSGTGAPGCSDNRENIPFLISSSSSE